MKVDNLPQDYPEMVCLMGQGEACCSYLMIGSDGLCCAKGTGFQKMIDRRRAEKSMRAMSDNCSGPPDFNERIARIGNGR